MQQQIGSYNIIRLLGGGGFAKVFLGEHVFLKTRAAIKILHTHGADNEQEQFLTEARHIAHLEHPHIIRVLDFGLQDSYPFLVMQYAPNGSLHNHYAGKILPLSQITGYVTQIASALQYAHDQGIIHRDVKPANILLGRAREVLLGDFGIAVIAESFRKPIDVSGTLVYTAPEQLQGRPHFASDQYALGVVVYQWLSGAAPFTGDARELYHQHLFAIPLPLKDRVEGISPQVESVVMRALAKHPQDRFGSIQDFGQALEQASQQVSIDHKAPTIFPLSPTINPPSNPSVPLHGEGQPVPRLTVPIDDILKEIVKEVRQSPSPTMPLSIPLPIPEKESEGSLESLKSPAPASLALPIPENMDESKSGESEPAPPPLHPPVARPLVIALTRQTPGPITYQGHTGWIADLAWAPDGQRIASASWDGTVRVWNVAQGETTLIYRGHTQPVKALAWSPDGTALASAAWDNTAQIWIADTGALRLTLRGHNAPLETIDWSPDGLRIATADHSGTASIWSATTGERLCLYEKHAGSIWNLAWSPDGDTIATASYDGTVQIWHAETGKQIITYHEHRSWVSAVAWSYTRPGEIASASHNGLICVWNSHNGQTSTIYHGHHQAIKALAWSPRKDLIASAVKDVQLWHATGGQQTYTYTGHNDWINAVSWSPDGKRLASGGDDQVIHIWQPE